MTGLLLLVPIAIGLGLLALFAFVWCIKSRQFDDLDGAASRILLDDVDAKSQTGIGAVEVRRAKVRDPAGN